METHRQKTQVYHLFGLGDEASATSKQLAQLASRITVEAVMTPRPALVCASPSTRCGDALTEMGDLFDQLPVLDGETFLGLVFRDDLVNVDGGEVVSAHTVPASELLTVKSSDILLVLNQRLEEQACVPVLDEAGASLVGLVHFSDLNKSIVRANLYLWLAAFEMGLAALVRQNCPDFNEWLQLLNESRQMAILGRYEFARRQHIELDPVEGADLSDLLKIIRSVPRLLDLFGLTRNQFDKKTGHLVHIRHAVMHPVRTLISSQEQLRETAALRADMLELLDATYRALEASHGHDHTSS